MRLLYALCYLRLGYGRRMAWALAAEGRPQVPTARRVRSYVHDLVQAGILGFGGAGAWMVSAPAGSATIGWGFAVLLVSQLFWFVDVFRSKPLRWGVLVNVLIYTAVWIRGFVNYF